MSAAKMSRGGIWAIVSELSVRPRRRREPPTPINAPLQRDDCSLDDGPKRLSGFHTVCALVPPRIIQFIKFCLVGGSGVVVDMTVLYLLADPRCLGLNVSLSKILAAETALLNNFLWNEFWTFKLRSTANHQHEGWFRRFVTFNIICGIGIGFAVLLLQLFHSCMGMNLYLSNLLAILVVTFWNFMMNSSVNWSRNRE